jgi:hypothetical protein
LVVTSADVWAVRLAVQLAASSAEKWAAMTVVEKVEMLAGR